MSAFHKREGVSTKRASNCKEHGGRNPERNSGKHSRMPNRRAFTSGFPMDGAIACEALTRIFARAEVEAKDLAGFRFDPGVHPDWMRAKENRESDPACALAEIEEITVMILERLRGWATQSPKSGRGRWAAGFLSVIESEKAAGR